MANEKTPKKGKEGKKKKPVDIDVILVVKGAGEQAEDVHLNQFIRGFWPAVKSLDKNATIAQITDELEGYKASPHNEESDKHKHLTEIHATYGNTKRRIWVKESYWEAETLPSSALGNLSKEWRMSSFVFASMFQDIFFTRNTDKLRQWRMYGDRAQFWPGLAPGTRIADYIGNYISYSILFLLVFLPFLHTISSLPYVMAFTSGIWLNWILLAAAVMATCAFLLIAITSIRTYIQSRENILMDILLASILPIAFIIFLAYLGLTLTASSDSLLKTTSLVIALASIWAFAPAFEISVMTYLRYKKDLTLKNLPGLPGWVLVALILLLVSNPLAYILIVLLFLTLQIALILSRRILWKYRKYANSDMDIAEYYSYEEETRDGNIKRIEKVDEPWLTRFLLSPWLYRYFIFLTLPITFVGTVLVRFLRWTRILGGVGEALDKIINTALVGFMDDVVNYAMDPAQAHRVRSAVKDDIIYFHNRPEVKRIHVIAHSQGTPITFETLFQFLEPEHQKKIHTYMTIGSVLSLYYQARGILDPIKYNRFQAPIRKEDKFPKEFRWMNFWNFTDPITEFYGLDEYTWFKKAPPIDQDFERGPTSPTNIRSHSSLLENHGEYWNNIGQINLPFAKRVLGEPRPEEWNPETVGSKDWHHWGVLILWILITAAAGLVGYWMATSEILKPLFSYFNHIYKSGLDIFTELFPPPDEPNLLQRINSLAAKGEPNPLTNLELLILNGSLITLGVVALLDWAGQLSRTWKIWREGNRPISDEDVEKTKK